jgi:hypothetical protein
VLEAGLERNPTVFVDSLMATDNADADAPPV